MLIVYYVVKKLVVSAYTQYVCVCVWVCVYVCACASLAHRVFAAFMEGISRDKTMDYKLMCIPHGEKYLPPKK